MIKNLIIIDGAAGPGKQDLVQYIRDKRDKRYKNTVYVNKYTTKPQNEISVPSDLISCSESEFATMRETEDFKTYKYGSDNKIYSYGFYISHIEEALTKNDNVFVIIRNRSLIDEITLKFQNKYRVTILFIYSEKEALVQHYLEHYPKGHSAIGIDERVRRTTSITVDLIDYYKKTYNEPVIYFSDRKRFYTHLTAILGELNNNYDDYIDISPQEIYLLPRTLREYKQDIMAKMNYRNRGFDKNIFLMIDFHNEAYSEYCVIKQYIESRDYNCVCLKRSTIQGWETDRSHWNIIADSPQNFWAVTFCCKYGIALFDKPIKGQDYFNPNVMYELGLMHQQRKRCLIIMHKDLQNVVDKHRREEGAPYDFVKDNYETYETYEKEKIIINLIDEFINNIETNANDNVFLPLYIK
jgi:ribose 1,5-bisphosphokinase PhnN